MTTKLHIETFGHLRIHLGDDQPIRFVSRRAELLIVYLAITQRPHTRDALATLLWDDRDQKQSLANLRSLLTRLPKSIKLFLQIDRHSIGIEKEARLAVDALQFESAISHSLSPVIPQQLEPALADYTGPFLTGVHVRDSFGLEEWMAVQREKFGRIAATARHTLATSYLHQRSYRAGIEHAQQLVESDSINEAYQRLLLRLLAKNGQFNDALKAYAACRQTLHNELAIEPSAETEQLVQRIRAARAGIPHRVPQMINDFVGRSAEIATINSQFDNPNRRLVTLVGMGGIGKTRLALAIAEARRNDYLDGIVFVSLADQQADASDGAIAAAIARACHVPETDRDALSRLLDHVQTRELLLILDNVEQCIDSCGRIVAALLQGSTKLQLLVTSRERLLLRDEWLHTIDGLPYEANAGDPAQTVAAELFLRRAAQVSTGEHNQNAVTRICALVEGTPLAIELAAASAGVESAETVADSIAATYASLRVQFKDVPARHHSLRAVFEHSWRLLTADQQQLLSTLSVFVGSFDRAAVAGLSAHADQLDALVVKSLVRTVPDTGFDLHPIVAEFAGEKLTDRAALIQAHRDYFAEWLVARNAAMQDERQITAMAAVRDLFANCDAAWRSAVAAQAWDTLAKMVEPFHHFHETTSQHRSGYERFAEGVALLRPLVADQPELALLFGRMLVRLGYFSERIDRYDEATAALEESLTWLTHHEHDEDILLAMSHLGMVAYSAGDFPTARSRYERALAISRELGHNKNVAYTLSHLGYILTALGERDAAVTALEESVPLWRELGNQQNLAIALNGLASAYLELNRLAEALPVFEENVALCRQLDDTMGQIFSLMNAGRCHLALEDLDTALATTQAARDLCTEDAHREGIRARLDARLGDIYLARNESHAAAAAFDACLQTSLKLEDGWGVPLAMVGLADCALRAEDWVSAETHLKEILARCTPDNHMPLILRALLAYAQLAHHKQAPALAASTLHFVLHHPQADAAQRQSAEELAASYQLQPATSHPFEQLLTALQTMQLTG